VALTKDDFPEDVRTATKTAIQQEMARLLYVATTRARHTLVLALDEGIFARPNGEILNGAQLKCLHGEKQINRPHFDRVDVKPTACVETARTNQNIAATREARIPLLKQIGPKELKRAHVRAADFVRKLNPSGYDQEIVRLAASATNEDASSVNLPRSTTDTPATLYGRWWHQLVQQLPWRDRNSWKLIFDEHQSRSPVPARSVDEWNLFLQYLEKNQDFLESIANKESVAHAEMPFLWLADKSRCLEGIVDLAIFNTHAKRVFVLDWKTNRIASDQIEHLRNTYRPQMAAYWRAMTGLSESTVQAAIYSTAVGRLIIYERDELTTEWERLRKLPENVLTNELAKPELN
jgi:ATP-dependent exoDNAse (exonuclease V) beta subunit